MTREKNVVATGSNASSAAADATKNVAERTRPSRKPPATHERRRGNDRGRGTERQQRAGVGH